MNNTGPTFVDLFCGAGGASEGLVAAGMHCVLAVDMDLDALASHKANHPSTDHVLMDMTRPAIRWEKLQGRVDMVHGSPPCQNLSVSNKNRDVGKALVTLRAYETVISQVQPRWFTMENVPMVKHHLNGLYKKVRVFNAANFGVPQTRRRVFAGVFPDPAHTHTKNGPLHTLAGQRLERWVSLGEVLGLEGYVNTGQDWRGPDDQQERQSDQPAPSMTTRSGGQWKIVDQPHIVANRQMSGKNKPRKVRTVDQPSFTLTTKRTCMTLHPGGGTPGVGECRAIPRTMSEPAHTLVSRPPELRSRSVGRRLSLQECAALQSFPPDYIFIGNKTTCHRLIGNAVPPLMAEAIGRAIMNEWRHQ